MTAAKKLTITEAEYLAGELVSDVRHELVAGEAYAMVGARKAHNLIAGNLHASIWHALKGGSCDVFMADMKVKVADDFYYPDVLVDCSPLADDALYTETPVLIIEVLSDSTRRHDRLHKFAAYQNIASLQEYVMVEQSFLEIEVFCKENAWQPMRFVRGDVVEFKSLNLSFPIEDIYAGLQVLTEDDKPKNAVNNTEST